MATTQGAVPHSDNGAELRRHTQLAALRDEMIALLSLLEVPYSGASPSVVPAAKPMRPRLVLEPRPLLPRSETSARPEMRLMMRESFHDIQRGNHQSDLFAGE